MKKPFPSGSLRKRQERKIIDAVGNYLKNELEDSKNKLEIYRIYPKKPSNFHPYYLLDRRYPENCWHVCVPWYDGLDGMCLRSSRVILVSKRTYRVLGEVCANDEG